MAAYGADAAELRALATQLDRAAQKLDSARQQLSQQLGATTAWRGPDAMQFHQAWNSQSAHRITAATTSLNSAAAALRRNAQEQETASNAGGGAAPAAVGPNRKPVGNPPDVAGLLAGAGGVVTGYLELLKKGITGAPGKALNVAGGALSVIDLVGGAIDHDNLREMIGAMGVGAAAAGPVVGWAAGGALLYANLTLPTSSADYDGVLDAGARSVYGKDLAQLTPQQRSQFLDHRYEGAWGVANMISDSMDSKAHEAQQFLQKIPLVGKLFGG